VGTFENGGSKSSPNSRRCAPRAVV